MTSRPLPFKILGIDHLGLAPKDLAESRNFFQHCLQLPFLGSEEVADQQVHVDMFSGGAESRLELLAPLLNEGQPQGPIAAFLQKKGSGIHHLALRVAGIEAALHWLREDCGLTLIDQTPRIGANGSKIAFIHPKSTGGILVELVEPQ